MVFCFFVALWLFLLSCCPCPPVSPQPLSQFCLWDCPTPKADLERSRRVAMGKMWRKLCNKNPYWAWEREDNQWGYCGECSKQRRGLFWKTNISLWPQGLLPGRAGLDEEDSRQIGKKCFPNYLLAPHFCTQAEGSDSQTHTHSHKCISM